MTPSVLLESVPAKHQLVPSTGRIRDTHTTQIIIEPGYNVRLQSSCRYGIATVLLPLDYASDDCRNDTSLGRSISQHAFFNAGTGNRRHLR